MKKIFKITIISIVFFLSISQINIVNGSKEDMVYTNSFLIATNKKDDTTFKPTDWKDGFKYGDDFIKKGYQADDNSITTISDEDLRNNASAMFKVFVAIGTVLTVIVGVILGISFMMASAEDKAQIKEKMVPYVVGCFVIYGAIGIWFAVVQILGRLN